MLDYSKLPNPDAADTLRMYFEEGIHPGGFLSAVLRNDLRGACERADSRNILLLVDYVRWLYNEAPLGTWGSDTAYRDTIDGARAQSSR